MALALDGTASGTSNTGNTTGPSAVLTTSNTDDIIVAIIWARSSSSAFASATISGAGLTWTRRWQKTDIKNTSDFMTLELWSAHAASALSSQTISTTFDIACGRCALIVFGVNGANLANPFDPNTGLPYLTDYDSTVNTATHNVTFNTNNSNDFLIGILASDSTTLIDGSPAAGWSDIAVAANFSMGLAAQYKIVSLPQNNVTENIYTSNTNMWLALVDAITADSSATTGTVSSQYFNITQLVQSAISMTATVSSTLFSITEAATGSEIMSADVDMTLNNITSKTFAYTPPAPGNPFYQTGWYML